MRPRVPITLVGCGEDRAAPLYTTQGQREAVLQVDRTPAQCGGRVAAGCHIFVSFCSKDESAYMVDPLTAQGVAVVIVAYDIAPKGYDSSLAGLGAGGHWRGASPSWKPARVLCAGTLDHMVDQVTRSILFLQKQYPCNE